MATTVKGTVTVDIKFSTTKDSSPSTSDNSIANNGIAQREEYTDGSGGTQANKVFKRTYVGVSGNTDLDLNGGGLTDDLGNVLNFTSIKILSVRNKTTAATKILQIGGLANQVPLLADATDIATIGPGGVFTLTSPIDGFTVTPATGDKIRIAAGANAIDFEVLIVGS